MSLSLHNELSSGTIILSARKKLHDQNSRNHQNVRKQRERDNN